MAGFWDQALSRGPPPAGEALSGDLIARGPQAPRQPRLQAAQRRIEDIKTIRVVTYNVLNLAEKVGNWVPDPSRRGFRMRATPMGPKDPKQTEGVAKALTGKGQGQAGLVDALDLVVPPLAPAERVTHTYHPNRARSQRRQLDAILLSNLCARASPRPRFTATRTSRAGRCPSPGPARSETRIPRTTSRC